MNNFTNGFRDLGLAICCLRVNNLQSNVPSLEWMKTSQKFVNCSCRKVFERDTTCGSWSSTQRILSVELRMKGVASKIVDRSLTEDQKESLLNACRELNEYLEVDLDSFSKAITHEESWCNRNEAAVKSMQEFNLTIPRPKVRQVKSNVKMSLICFINAKGIVSTEFVVPS